MIAQDEPQGSRQSRHFGWCWAVAPSNSWLLGDHNRKE
jgi:hypothetical protein